jgi:hypothetical protein
VSLEKQRFGPKFRDEDLILLGNESRFAETDDTPAEFLDQSPPGSAAQDDLGHGF